MILEVTNTDRRTLADFTTDQVLDALTHAMSAGDVQAAADMLAVLAVRDPNTADLIAALIHERARSQK